MQTELSWTLPMKGALCALCALVTAGIFGCGASNVWKVSAGQHPEEFEKETTRTLGAKFLLYVPKAFGSEKKNWPLVVFLHGLGERGDDLEKVKVHGPPKLVERGNDFPFILVSPQCPANGWWSVDVLNALLDEVIARLPVDTDRIYLTGLSMGGFGTWNFALAHPERFAAIAPICGGGSVEDICRLKDMPIWVFHGAKDDVVPLSEGQRMVNVLTRCGNDSVRLTIYPEAGHDSWTETYANPELYSWFLSHTRQR